MHRFVDAADADANTSTAALRPPRPRRERATSASQTPFQGVSRRPLWDGLDVPSKTRKKRLARSRKRCKDRYIARCLSGSFTRFSAPEGRLTRNKERMSRSHSEAGRSSRSTAPGSQRRWPRRGARACSRPSPAASEARPPSGHGRRSRSNAISCLASWCAPPRTRWASRPPRAPHAPRRPRTFKGPCGTRHMVLCLRPRGFDGNSDGPSQLEIR